MTNDLQPLDASRLKEVRRILVSQPVPTDPASPYFALSTKFDVKIDFRQFIRIDPVDAKDFRRQKVNMLDYTAVIFNSRNAVDHYFRIANENKVEMPATMKYFCVSEQTANYLQKYIIIRKRKIFTGEKTVQDLMEVMKKHKNEKFLYPCTDVRKEDIPEFMEANGFKYKEAIIYRTVAADLSDIRDVNYDIIAFFTPMGITSLFENFPDFKQKDTRIAAFGNSTAKAVREAGLILDIEAPLPNAPSMTGALELYIKQANAKK